MDADKQPKNKLKGKPFTKGHSGNPNGRPPKLKCIPDLLRWASKLKCPDNTAMAMCKLFDIEPPITVEQALVLRSVVEGLKGNVNHLEFWAERTEGKPTQPIDLNAEQPLVVMLQPPEKKQ